jgi:hypothetical protein
MLIKVAKYTVDFETELGNYILNVLKEKETKVEKATYIGEAIK